jgi:4-alpha-glucanotransferase
VDSVRTGGGQTGTVQGRDGFGVADGWWGTDGSFHAVDEDVRGALRRAVGADEHPDGPPPGPTLWFVRPGGDRSVWSPGELRLEDGGRLEVREGLPDDLPLGVHELTSDGGHRTLVCSVPGRGRRFPRGWGWAAQLPGVRSRTSWGHGDLADLGALARWAADGGASVLAHNPLGDTVPVLPQQPSPYYASSRRFWSPLYLRVEDVDGADRAGASVAVAAAAGRALGSERTIDRDQVWDLKLHALEAVWTAVRDTSAVRDRLAMAEDPALVDHARFCVLAELHGGGRAAFPAEHAHPRSAGVASTAARHHDRVDFWRWVQWGLDDQLSAAARAGATLMADLPVGFDPDGADAWADQDLLAAGCRVGAPPDDFSPTGQDWGLPPYVPWRLRARAYGPWRDTLRRVLRHAGALRVDHVMGLFRLFWIPPGADARSGGYVYQYGTELLDLALMEAVRADAVLVGEDLGTVEPEVRTAMGDRDVSGYKVGWFEDDPPPTWPAASVGMLSTHDLPTVAGLCSGADARARSVAGLDPDPRGDALLRERLDRLVRAGGGDPGGTAGEVTVAAHRALGTAGSDLVVASLEDAVGVEVRPNLPGTVDQHPNWRLALPVPLEELDDAGAQMVADAVSAGRRSG